MAQSRTWRDWHWPHLLLLALLGPAFAIGQSMPASLALAAWLALNLGVLAAAERIRPERGDWHPDSADLRRDASVFTMNSVVDGLGKAAIAAAAIHLPAYSPVITAWPWPAQLVVGALVADLGSYALHRWSHGGGWLWRVHVFHHRPEALNVANALTAHPINALYDGMARTVPLVLLGVKPSVITALAMFHLTQSLVAHANVRGGLGPLHRVLGNAALHRRHHSVRAADAGNFGTDLTVWDRVFGTYRDGTAPVAVGVFHPQHYPEARAWWRLMAWPFRL